MARPVTRGRAQGLSRLTAPVHRPWFWPALWAAAAAASFIALVPVLFPDGAPVPGYETIHTLSGVSFAACGLIAWRRRPDSAVGRLLTAAGFGVLIGPILTQLESPVALTLAALVGELWIIAFVTLILSFVTGGRLVTDGRPRARLDVLRRAVRAAARGAAVPRPARQRAARVARRRARERAGQGPVGALERRRRSPSRSWSARAGARRRPRAGERCCPASRGACAGCSTPPGSRASRSARPS